MIVGYRNESRGYVFCLECYQDFLNDFDVSERVTQGFIPIHKEEKWVIDPSCTECSKGILY